MSCLILAESRFDNVVQLIDNGRYYSVKYGKQVNEFNEIYEAWDEFKSCTQHAMKCAGLLDHDE